MFNYYLEAFKRYADFNGRSNRPEYWYFVLFSIIISILISIVAGMIRLPILSTIYSLVVLVPSLAAGVRRMHDIGKSGWWILVPLYNIYLLAQPTTSTSGK